jgi:hypothetical protein
MNKIIYPQSENKQINPNTNNFNTMAGDRISYCDDNINEQFNNDKIKYLIEQIISINEQSSPERINMVIKSFTHMIDKKLNFTIFPQNEYFFNTEKFVDSLKEFKNFKYYSIYVGLLSVFKYVAKKLVGTNNCKEILDKIFLDNPLLFLYNNTINYLSIRICGRLLTPDENLICNNFIKNNDSKSAIEYIEQLNPDDSIDSKLKEVIDGLGRNPKVLIMIAFLETQNPVFIEKMLYHIHKMKELNTNIDIEFALESERISKKNSDYTPWSRVKRIRNVMIEKYPIHNYDYLYIIDSDIIDYPHNFISRAIALNPTGITAPVALIQYSNVFYDWCGYQKKDVTTLNSPYKHSILTKMCPQRNFQLLPPYVIDDSRLVELDCVGCTYVIPSAVFSYSYNDKKDLIDVFNLTKVTDHKINQDKVQYEDHPTFTDHYTVCAALRNNGGKIYMDRGSVAYHADLPLYGEEWH